MAAEQETHQIVTMKLYELLIELHFGVNWNNRNGYEIELIISFLND